MTATPRPWAYSRRNWRNEPDAHSFYITGDRHEGDAEDEGDYSTAVAIVCGNATAGTIPEDNAKLIVKAVNCHDDLLAALQAVRNHGSRGELDGGISVSYLVESALAKAEST